MHYFILFGFALSSLLHLFMTRHLIMENIALRLQLLELRRKRKKVVPSQLFRIYYHILFNSWSFWKDSLIIVTPETILRWRRMQWKKFWAMISRTNGRPPIDWELIKLIRKIAKENPLWGPGKILGVLLKLGYDISETTVEKYMPPKPRDPKKAHRWITFIHNHLGYIVAVDFFKIPSWNFRTIYTVMFFIHIGSRRVIHFHITENPTSAWCAQQLRNAFWDDEDIPKFLLTDNDPLFKGEFAQTLKSFGIRHIHTQPYSPWQNAYAERWVRTVREDCVNHIIPFSERHLMAKVKEFVHYYNADRSHRSLKFDSPNGKKVTPRPSPDAKVVSIPVLGGLHHRYEWEQKAA